ncbi:MAG: GEVED domain-containing protein [Bacteroidia bacterium]|jgi:phosphopantetheine adenylyltransferase|nr:GEVED domain-containing protein [Bacteroidia bacterium]
MKTNLPFKRATKLLFVTVAFSLFTFINNAIAQVSNYTFSTTGTTYTALPILAGPVIASGGVDDASFTNYPIGFPFVFNGTTYTTFSVNANGIVGLGNSINASYNAISDPWSGNNNLITPMSADLQGHPNGEIRYELVGTAPTRKLIVQFANWTFYWNNNNTSDTLNFQVILNETTNNVDIVYGNCVKGGTTNFNVEVGLRGTSNSDYNNRTTATDWLTTTQGITNNATCLLTNVGPVVPISGLTYRFVPPPKTYDTSDAFSASLLPAGPGSVNQEVVRYEVNVSGYGSTLAATQLHVNTNGTTSPADLSAMKVFFTGTSNVYSTATQFGSTITSPSGSYIVTDSVQLSPGVNYFWVAYDVAAGATLGNSIDAEVTTIQVNGVNKVPGITAPAGNRIITSPMSYVSSTVFQNMIQKVGKGDQDEQIIGVRVIMSNTGAPVNATQFAMSAAGSTDSLDIENIRVWYTGNSATFATTTQFGSTLTSLGGAFPFTISGNQALANDTNYFWLTYGIKSSATVTNIVDGECSSITIAGTPQTPTVTSPVGSREIRNPYCAPQISNATNACNWGYYMTGVSTTGAINNINNFTGCNGNPNNWIYYPTQTLVVNQAQSFDVNLSGASWMSYSIWIDYNQDGVFSASELAFQTPNDVWTASATISIPCSALPGLTRMRVRQGPNWWNGTPITDPCADYGYGETEDYAVNIIAAPVTFDEADAVQMTGIAAPGVTSRVILQMPVTNAGCGTAVVNEFRMSTAGSTNAADITAAKLYSTGGSNVFNTTNLRSTVASPSGAFTFAISDTIEPNGTTHYWLAYDIASGATVGDLIDATFDSVLVLGAYEVPNNSNPSGNITVTAPMTYVSSTTVQDNPAKVAKGSKNNDIIAVKVVMSPTGAPVSATQLNFSANGTTDTSEISNIKVWYTGNGNVFDTTTQFGTTLTNLPGALTFSVSGLQPLENDTNYFWLTYDISDTATVTNVVDGECLSIVLGATQTPTVSAPAGSREIREEYCTPQISWANNSCSWGYTINNFTTSGATSNISSFTGCGDINNNNYSNTPGVSMVTQQNQTFSFSIGGGWMSYAIWIDYNQDGVFDNATERVFYDPTATGNSAPPSGSITIPCNATTGLTRMRVRAGDYWWNGAPVSDPCSDYGYGESEDYTINILPNPVAFGNAEPVQQIGTAAPGVLSRQVLQIPITNSGCGNAVLTELRLSTSGSTSPATDILNAKLYSTGSSATFNTSDLRATVAAPSGQFVFGVTDTIQSSGTTYYWLTYDIAGGATIGNLVDARLDSIFVLGQYRVPTNGDPSGNITITAPMTYISSTTTQANLSKVARGTNDNEVIGVQIVTSSTGAAINLTELNFNANGTTDTADITGIKVWYTGNSNTFATTTQFGTTLTNFGGSLTFSVNGSLPLQNDTNYFWLTYDISSGAVLGNLIDAECSGVNTGVLNAPTTTAPAGTREIREQYCIPQLSQAQFSCGWYNISGFQTSGGITNINNNFNGCPGTTISNNYTYFAGQTLTVNQAQTVNFDLYTAGSSMYYTIWIDLNQDGIFTANEVMATTGSTTFTNYSSSFTIPCSALPGLTRMRVRQTVSWWAGLLTNPCSDYGYGESEDYDVMINAAPLAYGSSTTSQSSSTGAPSSTDNIVLQIPVATNGCGVGTITEFRFNTNGTTSASDIAAAKVYRTTVPAFSTANLIATVASPSGSFTVAVTDTLESNATTYYWLAYDIAAGAGLGNLLDAQLDSIQVIGNYYIPTVTSPSGNIVVTSPMTYVGSTTHHSATTKVAKGTANNEILQIPIITSSTGAPINLTQFDLTATGTTDTANIRNMKVWYTGNSSVFVPTTQFGNTMPFLPGAMAYTITGFQPLANDTNYFWVTYDVDASSVSGNVIDATCTSFTLSGAPHSPAVTSPAGNREIRDNYCIPSISGTPYITNITLNSMNFNPPTNTAPGYYINYPTTTATATITKLNTESISITTDNNAVINMWIDFNDDGIFSPTEMTNINMSSTSFAPSTVSFTVPATAVLGPVRMRIMTRFSGNPNTDPCRVGGSGEAQDYTITILPTPPATTYTWNQTSAADFTVASNWTPARTTPVGNDRLVFNGGGSVTVNNVPSQTISKLTIDNSTVVTFNSAGTVTFSVNDTIEMISGRLNSTNNNFTLSLGVDTSNVGSLLGTPMYEGILRRWVNATTTNYTFPLYTGANNNTASLTFTTAPVGGTITARFINTAPGNNGLPLTDGLLSVTKASPFGYWRFTTANGFSGGDYTVNFTAEGAIGVTSFVDLRVIRRNNFIAPWSLVGTAGVNTGTNAVPVVERTGVNVVGEFGIGADSSVNPLPVTLTQFKASAVRSDAHLNWVTVSELNNAGFEVERSVDGRTFRKVGYVQGAGTTNITKRYAYIDRNAFTNANATVLYYRLRQVDFNGQSYTTQAVRVSKATNETTGIVAYPNPFSNVVSFDVTAAEEGTYTYTVMDVQGKVYATSKVDVKEGLNTVTVAESDKLAPGIYFLTVSGKESTTIKVVKTQ